MVSNISAMTAALTETSPAFVSSTGGVGFEYRLDPVRTDEPPIARGYTAHNEVVYDTEQVLNLVERTATAIENLDTAMRQAASRAVTRTVVTSGVLAELIKREVPVEAAIPTKTDANKHLIWIGENRKDRPSLPSHPAYPSKLEDTIASEPRQSMAEIRARAEQQGVQFHEAITDEIEPKIVEFWQEKFGWTDEQVKNVQQMLKDQVAFAPQDRQMWFSASTDADGNITGIALGERYDIEDTDGSKHIFIESTEWSNGKHIKRDADGQPIDADPSVNDRKSWMLETIMALHEQIHRDVPEAQIYAETNLSNGAPTTAYRAGMRTARVALSELLQQADYVEESDVAFDAIEHILKANVCVGAQRPSNFLVVYQRETL